jgi:hypothetical protein
MRTMTDSYLLRLPAGDPKTYLSWVAHWREVEAKMLENPALEEIASREFAPFLHGETALRLSVAVREMTKQATAAAAKGRPSIAPEIRLAGSAAMLGEMAFFLQRRSAWVDEHGSPFGVDGPSMDVRQLRIETIGHLRAEARRLSE